MMVGEMASAVGRGVDAHAPLLLPPLLALLSGTALSLSLSAHSLSTSVDDDER
jgi:hypothetical protein